MSSEDPDKIIFTDSAQAQIEKLADDGPSGALTDIGNIIQSMHEDQQRGVIRESPKLTQLTSEQFQTVQREIVGKKVSKAELRSFNISDKEMQKDPYVPVGALKLRFQDTSYYLDIFLFPSNLSDRFISPQLLATAAQRYHPILFQELTGATLANIKRNPLETPNANPLVSLQFRRERRSKTVTISDAFVFPSFPEIETPLKRK